SGGRRGGLRAPGPLGGEDTAGGGTGRLTGDGGRHPEAPVVGASADHRGPERQERLSAGQRIACKNSCVRSFSGLENISAGGLSSMIRPWSNMRTRCETSWAN